MIFETYTSALDSGGLEYGFTFKEAAGVDDTLFDMVLGVTYERNTETIKEVTTNDWNEHRWAAQAIVDAHAYRARSGQDQPRGSEGGGRLLARDGGDRRETRQADADHRWCRPGSIGHHWYTLEEAIKAGTPPSPFMKAIISVLTQAQQENVLRQLGWTERNAPIPPRVS